MFLFERIDDSRNFNAYKELPGYIAGNLNPAFDLRPYQIDAFRNFITFFCQKN